MVVTAIVVSVINRVHICIQCLPQTQSPWEVVSSRFPILSPNHRWRSRNLSRKRWLPNQKFIESAVYSLNHKHSFDMESPNCKSDKYSSRFLFLLLFLCPPPTFSLFCGVKLRTSQTLGNYTLPLNCSPAPMTFLMTEPLFCYWDWSKNFRGVYDWAS